MSGEKINESGIILPSEERKILDFGSRLKQGSCPVCGEHHPRLTKCNRSSLVARITNLAGIAGSVPHLLEANKKAGVYMKDLQKMAKDMTAAVELFERVCSENGESGKQIWAKYEAELEKLVCQADSEPTSQDTSEPLQQTESTIQN